MSQAPQRSEAFAQRLQRIEGNAPDAESPAVEAAVEPAPAMADTVPMPTGSSSSFGFGPIRIGLILLTMLGIFGMGAMTILNLTEGQKQESVKPVVVRR